MSDRLVRPRAAIVAGVAVGLLVAAVFAVMPVPGAIVGLFGGPSHGVDRHGGLRITYRPPPGIDVDALQRHLMARSEVRRAGDLLVLDFPGVAQDQAEELRELITEGGLQMKEALETDRARELAAADPSIVDVTRRGHDVVAEESVELDVDTWRPEDSQRVRRVYFLRSHSRVALERALSTQRRDMWLGVSEPGPEAKDPRPVWRTYELASEVAIDGDMIENAVGSYDPNTSRPIILLDFTPEGAKRFCEVTRRIVGSKLATVLGGRVRSAPVINTPICGGRALITMGGGDARTQERERDELVAVLSHGALPAGGSVERSEWYAPPDVRGSEWLGRLLLGLVAGMLCGILTALAIRLVRPAWRSPAAPVAGRFPVRRLLVTLVAPVALIGLAMLSLPGVNDIELEAVMRGHHADLPTSVIALGLSPIITAFGLVELVALAIPRLRKLRHSPRGRIALGKAAAATTLAIVLLQGYFVAVYLEALSRGGYYIVFHPGLAFRLLVMATLAGGTLVLAVVAGMIREHGLGNGYGVLVLSGWLIALAHGPFSFAYALGLVATIAIAGLAVAVLLWRIGGEREAQLRVPSSGLAPLADAGAIIVLLLSTLGIGSLLPDSLAGWVMALHGRAALALGLAVVLVPVWSWIYARPSLVAPLAARAGLAPPSTATWARATAVSAVFVVAVGVIAHLAELVGSHVDPVLAVVATAVILDVIGDARAHRRRLEPAWVLHQIQYAGIIERTLVDAGIPCHLHASNLRTVLAFFGPFAPVIVLVPVELASEARIKIAALFE